MSADDPGFELVTLPDPDEHEQRQSDARRWLSDRRLPPSLHDHKAAARHYRPSPDLLMAINMALNVGAPLLLTGEPGTGKTQVADFLAWYFDIPLFKDTTTHYPPRGFPAIGHNHSATPSVRRSSSGSSWLVEAQRPFSPPADPA